MKEQDLQYRVFISYRRTGGDVLAHLIRDRLEAHGVHCFLDVEDLRSSYFDESLLKRIQSVTNFVVILTPGCLERCADPNDWFRTEIAHAIASRRTIVPILFADFEFPRPEALPPEIASLPRFNGVRYSHDYVEAFTGKLLKLLTENAEMPAAKPESPIHKQTWLRIAVAAVVTIASIVAVYRFRNPRDKLIPPADSLSGSQTSLDSHAVEHAKLPDVLPVRSKQDPGLARESERVPVPASWPLSMQVLAQISVLRDLSKAVTDYRAMSPPRIERLDGKTPGAYLAVYDSNRVHGYFFYDGLAYVAVDTTPERRSLTQLPDSLRSYHQLWLRATSG